MIHVFDAILGLVIMEAIGLAVFNRLTRRGIPPRRYLANLAAGFCLLLTARLALAGASAAVLAACLFASLCAHVLDIGRQWTRGRS